MPSFSVTISIEHPPASDEEDPRRELGVAGVLEWTDADFTLKRADGGVLVQLETKLAYRQIGVDLLMAADAEIELSGADATFGVVVDRKHRNEAHRALRELIGRAAATDAGFRTSLQASSTVLLRRGIWCTSVSAAVLLLGGLVAKSDGAFCVLAVFALGLLVGPALIYSALQQRHLLRRAITPGL